MGWLGLPALVLACFTQLAGERAAPAEGATPPNVIVVMTDDQWADSVSVMPNVQSQLRAHGTTFRNSFVSDPLCCPSRATFLTGQYAHNHGVIDNVPPLGGYAKLDHSDTLPVWMQAAGYRTAYVGKYMNGYNEVKDIPPGWDEWFGHSDRGTFWNYELNENGELRFYGDDPEEYQTDVYADKAVDFIHGQTTASEPFFLTVGFGAPHKENDDELPPGTEHNPRPAPRHAGLFADEPLPMPPSFNEADVSDKPSFISSRPLLSSNRVSWVEARYRDRLASLLAVDDAVGAIVEALRATDQLGNTLIVFTSDHGTLFGVHRITLNKRQLYEEALRVPLIMRGPGIPERKTTGKIVGNVDLAPTIVDVADATPGHELDGRSLIPLVLDEGSWPNNRDLLLENLLAGESDPDRISTGIRNRRYLYAEHPDGETELYDLPTDPYQLESKHADPDYARVQRWLRRKLARLRTCAGETCWQ
jgi:N-acetylglucosamine-6-sulfatase